MSRLNYSEDEDYPGQFGIWRANMARSLAGKRGKQALADLEAALLGLPEKRLIAHHLVKGDDVCGNGALVEYRRSRKLRLSREEVLELMREETRPACSDCYHPKPVHGLAGCKGCIDRVTKYDIEGPRWVGAHRPEVCARYVVRMYDPKTGEYVEDPTESYDDSDDDDNTQTIAEREGVPKMVATAIIEANDGWDGSHDRLVFDPTAEPRAWDPPGPGRYVTREETPEQRYDRVLRWVRRAQVDPHAAAFDV